MNQRTGLFAYDIRNDRLRRHALRRLRAWRLDGQLSVHQCQLTEADARAIFQELRERIDPTTDRLLFGWLQLSRPLLSAVARPQGSGASGLLHLV